MAIGVGGDLVFQLGLVIIIAAVAAFFFRLIKQPQILSYVLVGLLITPLYTYITGENLLGSGVIESMSLIGVAFLLFIVGLDMDLKSLKNVTVVSTFGGVIQIIVIFIFGYLASLLLGFLSLEAAYIGLMIAFSSTMVVIKLLSDRRELNTLHGRIIVGTLLMQDLVAILALSILTSVNDFSLAVLGIALVKFISLFLLAYIASKYIFPPMFRFAAKYQELLLINSLAVCFLFALAYHYLGFSLAIGAFIAGIALGNLKYNFEIIGKVKSLKDFFSLLFFVSLGMGVSITVFREYWLHLVVILILVMVLKPLVIMTVCSLFKYTKKPSFLTASSLAQVGEFSLILASQGLILGHLSNGIFSLVVVVTLITITLTSYYIEYSRWTYKIMRIPLKIFDVFTTQGLEYLPTEIKPSIVLCGHNRIGYSILRDFSKLKKKVLIIDFNPEIISKLVKQGYHCIYGDVTDEEIQDRMHLAKLKILVSTVPNVSDNLLLIRKLRDVNTKAKIFVTASEIDEALRLYNEGADYVILPHFLGGEHVSNLISNFRIKKISLRKEKKDHIKHLEERKDVGHEHPKQD